MRLILVVLILLACAALVSCTATNITELRKAQAEVIEALSKDPATVCVTVSYGPATVTGGRTNITNGDVQCTPSGMVIKSQATQLGVPMTVVPQLSIGAPTLTQPPPPAPAPVVPQRPSVLPRAAPDDALIHTSERLRAILRGWD